MWPIGELGPLANPPYSTAIDLANGDVLLFGLGLADIYSTNAGVPTLIPLTTSTSLQRTNATATTLSGDKKVLVVGGRNNANQIIAGAAVFNPAKVVTDKDDYQPGDQVMLFGFGWKPGEIVDIYVVDNYVTQPEWHYDTSVQADAHGNFIAEPFLFEVLLEHFGVTFDLSAVGQSSMLSAQTQFTDAEGLALFEDPTFCTNRTAFAWGSTVHAVISGIAPASSLQCYQLQWTAPNGVTYTNTVGGTVVSNSGCITSGNNRTNSFTIPSAGPSVFGRSSPSKTRMASPPIVSGPFSPSRRRGSMWRGMSSSGRLKPTGRQPMSAAITWWHRARRPSSRTAVSGRTFLSGVIALKRDAHLLGSSFPMPAFQERPPRHCFDGLI
jgi:hypothetical protein